MPRTPLTTRRPSLIIASRLLLDRAGNPIIDLAGNRVAVNKSPQPLTRRRASLFNSSTTTSGGYGSGSYGSSTYA